MPKTSTLAAKMAVQGCFSTLEIVAKSKSAIGKHRQGPLGLGRVIKTVYKSWVNFNLHLLMIHKLFNGLIQFDLCCQ